MILDSCRDLVLATSVGILVDLTRDDLLNLAIVMYRAILYLLAISSYCPHVSILASALSYIDNRYAAVLVTTSLMLTSSTSTTPTKTSSTTSSTSTPTRTRANSDDYRDYRDYASSAYFPF
jgi:hypothetical protein